MMITERARIIRSSLFTLCCTLYFTTACGAEVAVIAHPETHNSSVTANEIKKLFLGRLRMLPNTKQEVMIVDQRATQTSFVNFYNDLLKMSPVKLKSYRAAYLFSGKGRLPLKLDDDAAVRSFVASNVSAIGYIDVSMADESVKVIYVVPSK